MANREKAYHTDDPRKDAILYVTRQERDTLVVEKFLDAARPGGGEVMQLSISKHVPGVNAKKGIRGYVEETGKTFTIRDDWDFGKPGPQWKGYHVNVQLGSEQPRAYCLKGSSGFSAYTDRVQMTGQRVHEDGPEQAAKWYVTLHGRLNTSVKYEPR